MKVSDFIIRRLEEHGVRDVFLLSGGGMMHLLDSVFQSKLIRPSHRWTGRVHGDLRPRRHQRHHRRGQRLD